VTARLDALLRLAWHPHAVGRSPLVWPHVLVRHEIARVLPVIGRAEAARLEKEAARELAEAMRRLCEIWNIGPPPPRWTGPRRTFICEDDMPVRAQWEAACG